MDRIFNTLQQNYATFLETADQSGGAVTRVEVELAAGGGNNLHYHPSFTESFRVLAGTLAVRLGEQELLLSPGDTAIAERGQPHCFSNPTERSTTFLVELRPGSANFEAGLRIIYGLACDGKTNAKGIPRNFLDMAAVAAIAETVPVGPISLLLPLLTFVARTGAGRRATARLVGTYCEGDRRAVARPLVTAG